MAADHPSTPRDERSAELFGVLARIVHRTTQDAAAALRAEGLNPAQFQTHGDSRLTRRQTAGGYP